MTLYEVTIEADYQKVVAEGQIRRIAQAAITRGQILKFGASDAYVTPATNGTATLIGIALNSVDAADLAAYAADENEIHRVEVSIATIGYANLIAGEEITEGDWITAGAAGVGMVHAAADYAIGIAFKSADSGDQFHILIQPIPAAGRQ